MKSKIETTLALIVPCYNESAVLYETSKQLSLVLDQMIKEKFISEKSYILFVNDGSEDTTWNIIEELYATNQYVYGIKLSRNVGSQYALMAGLMTAEEMADITISIDADLQNDVKSIRTMIEKYYDGFDIVYGVRKNRATDSYLKKTPAIMFYKIMQLLGAKFVFNHSDYRLMSKRAVEQLSGYRERNLFLRGVIPLMGYNSTIIYYDCLERFAGKTKYSPNKMMSLALDGITSFSIKPIRIITGLGIVSLIISIIYMIYIIITFIEGKAIVGWASVILSIWFIGSIIIISIGVIGEYIGKIYIEVKDRPLYNIETALLRKKQH